jgi:nucleotide-binding universal stress UspA family protein
MNSPSDGYRGVLAATDFSEHGLAALKRGAWIAQQSCKRLVAAHVVSDIRKAIHRTSYRSRIEFLEGNEEHFQHELRRDADNKLQQQMASLGATGIDLKYETLLGEPFEELIHAVQQEGYDLVVAGSRGHSALASLIIGSTAKRLIRKCPGSVWIVKNKVIEPPTRILAAVDMSDVSQLALQQAVWAAQRADARLHVVHVIESTGLNANLLDTKVAGPATNSLRELIESEVRQQFEDFVSLSIPQGVVAKKRLLWGSPAQEVVGLANELKADLIVVGTVGRSGVEGVLLGNTAESVLAHCECDVLTVKPVKFVSPIKPATWPLHPGPIPQK